MEHENAVETAAIMWTLYLLELITKNTFNTAMNIIGDNLVVPIQRASLQPRPIVIMKMLVSVLYFLDLISDSTFDRVNSVGKSVRMY